jgi:hypothetical protein
MPIATNGDFVLFERPNKSALPWRNLKLIRTSNGPKRNWWLGWNGERLANGKDRKILAEHNPEIERWIISTLSANR